jgi:hypothetical protein
LGFKLPLLLFLFDIDECWVLTQFGWLEPSILVLVSKSQIGTKFDLWNQNWNWVLKWELILELDFFINNVFVKWFLAFIGRLHKKSQFGDNEYTVLLEPSN